MKKYQEKRNRWNSTGRREKKEGKKMRRYERFSTGRATGDSQRVGEKKEKNKNR